MLTYDSYRVDVVQSGSKLRGATRAVFYLGLGLGKTVRFITYPFRAIAGRAGESAGRRRERVGYPVPRNRVVTTLTRMHDRVKRLEEEIRAHGTPDPPGRWSNDRLDGATVEDPAVVVLEAMQDPDPAVRCEAADAAAKGGLISCVFSLILLLDDTKPRVRGRAAAAIESITGRKLDLSGSGADPRAQIGELKSWWKKERFTRLAAELEGVVRQ